MTAVKAHKDQSPSSSYTKPNLTNILPYLYEADGRQTIDAFNIAKEKRTSHTSNKSSPDKDKRSCLRRQSLTNYEQHNSGLRCTIFDLRTRYDKDVVQEERLIFIKILRAGYHKLIEHGELESRTLLAKAFDSSLNHAEDAASRGNPIEDWNSLQASSEYWTIPADYALQRLFSPRKWFSRRRKDPFDKDFFLVSFKVRQILAFIHAHDYARRIFKKEFSKGEAGCLTAAEKIVLDES